MKYKAYSEVEGLSKLELDVVGHWSETKLQIIEAYAEEYTKILRRFPKLQYAYIDAFCGAGMHFSKTSGKFVKGSPLRALDVKPPFSEYYFIDTNKKKIEHLRRKSKQRENVHYFNDDCNKILLAEVFPHLLYEDYWRAVCLLDPYGLHVDWKVIEKAGHMKSIEIFLNFPILDINRNVVRDHSSAVNQAELERMNRFWGDDSWFKLLYQTEPDLFEENHNHRVTRAKQVLPEAFRKRLVEVAGYRYVPEPIPMKNAQGGLLYYIFFASHNQTANKIVTHLFKKHK